jgi:hypothetical protein
LYLWIPACAGMTTMLGFLIKSGMKEKALEWHHFVIPALDPNIHCILTVILDSSFAF